MNLIPCSSNCVYQKDGECHLDRAASPGQPGQDGCAYFVGRRDDKENPLTFF